MIEGFRLQITSAELKDHCIKRSGYHGTKCAEYTQQLPRIKETIDALKVQGIPTSVSHMTKGGTYETDAVEELENKIRDHYNKSLVFTFFADHLFLEDYNLKEEDLIRLEILKR